MSVKEVLEQAQKEYEKLFVKCSECKHIMYSDCYGECGKGIRGIVNAEDGCIFGEKRIQNPPKPSEPSEKEYGCTVCKHIVSCEPNPFGICNEFEREEYQSKTPKITQIK